MPPVTGHVINEDLEKRRERRRHERALRPNALRKAIAQCCSAEDEADFVQTLTASARRTAESPPYDPQRLRAGEWKMAFGAAVLVVAAAAIFLLASGQEGLTSTLTRVLMLACMMVGVFLVWTGYELRNGENLPRLLTAEMVDEAGHQLKATQENIRHMGSSVSLQVSRAILLADGAVLFFLLTPVLLPSSTPAVHLIVSAIGALLVAKISSDAVGRAARAIRKGQVLSNHDALVHSADTGAHATAQAIRQAYGPVVGNRWPVSPGLWKLYGAVMPPVLVLLTLTSALLLVRLWLGQGATDLLAMGIVALIVFLSLAGAIALRLDSEYLTPAVAQAKRIVARFPSSAQFLQERRADHGELRAGLLHARRVLRAARRPRWHGAPARKADFATLDLDASPADTAIRRVGSLGTKLASASRSGAPTLAAPSVGPALVTERRAASGFRPNPHWDTH